MYELVIKCANAIELKELADRLDGYPGYFAPKKDSNKVPPTFKEPVPPADLEIDAPRPPRKMRDKTESVAEKAVEKAMKEPESDLQAFTYDDVKEVTLKLPRQDATALLAKFKCKVAPNLKESQWPAYVTEAREILANAALA